MSLVKTKTLLNLMTWKKPVYVAVSDEGVAQSVETITLDEEAWTDMGCPSTVTVTVEPGDTLNGGSE